MERRYQLQPIASSHVHPMYIPSHATRMSIACSSTVWHMTLQHKPLDSVPILIPLPAAGSVPSEPGTEGQQLGVMQKHEGWRKGWILAIIPATSLADLFCTVTK